MFNPKI